MWDSATFQSVFDSTRLFYAIPLHRERESKQGQILELAKYISFQRGQIGKTTDKERANKQVFAFRPGVSDKFSRSCCNWTLS